MKNDKSVFVYVLYRGGIHGVYDTEAKAEANRRQAEHNMGSNGESDTRVFIRKVKMNEKV